MAWLRITGKAKLYLYSSLSRTAFQAFLACLFLFSGFGVTGFVFAGFIACVSLSIVMAIIQLKDTGINFSLMSFTKYSVYGGPLIFSGFAGFILGSFDRWILVETTGPAIMAEYALAAKFGLITAVLIQPFDMWWHAKRFHTYKNEGAEKCASIALIGFVILSAAVLIVTSVSPFLITVLTPSTYHGAIEYVSWMVILAALHNLTQTLGFGIYLESNTKYPAIIDGGAALIALAAYFILIPRFEIEGAIMATALALTIRFIATLISAQSLNYIPYSIQKFACLGLYVAATSLWIKFSISISDQLFVGTLSLFGLFGFAIFLNILPYPKFKTKIKI